MLDINQFNSDDKNYRQEQLQTMKQNKEKLIEVVKSPARLKTLKRQLQEINEQIK